MNVRARARRPIDKKLIAFQSDNQTQAQTAVDLFNTNTACTITGLRWDITFLSNEMSGTKSFPTWAIVLVPEGDTENMLGTPPFYAPEQHVLVWGASYVSKDDGNYHAIGSTKTMRKLRGGDQIKLITRDQHSSGTSSYGFGGVVQLFCME